MPESTWPNWWHWPLELSTHLLKRMLDRDFSEVDLRRMLEDAVSIRPAIEPERWLVETQHDGTPWHVVVEPDSTAELLVIITAYPLDR